MFINNDVHRFETLTYYHFPVGNYICVVNKMFHTFLLSINILLVNTVTLLFLESEINSIRN